MAASPSRRGCIVAGQAEIEADALGVADMQITVRLGRKTSHHRTVVLASGQVLVDEGTNEVTRCRRSVAVVTIIHDRCRPDRIVEKRGLKMPQTVEKPPSELFRKWQISARKATVHYSERLSQARLSLPPRPAARPQHGPRCPRRVPRNRVLRWWWPSR